jgi:hypothetical protein
LLAEHRLEVGRCRWRIAGSPGDLGEGLADLGVGGADLEGLRQVLARRVDAIAAEQQQAEVLARAEVGLVVGERLLVGGDRLVVVPSAARAMPRLNQALT